MPSSLTARQQQVMDFIAHSIDTHGYPPTLREIADHLDISSTNGVSDHLKALKKKGYLEHDPTKSRGLRPVESNGHGFVNVPLLGQVAAGQPLLATENVEDTLRVDRFFIGSRAEVFALRVTGESMINAGIYDRDYIFVRKQLTAERGDIVVAMIEGEATVKYFYPEGDRIRFQPANDAMEPIYVHQDEFRSVDLIGIVVGVYRRVA